MLDKLAKMPGTALDTVTRYLNTTKPFRKILDVILACILMIIYAVATGKIPLPSLPHYNAPTHTVENTLRQSTEVQKVLDIAQNKHNLYYVGYYRYHNGLQGLDGFNFMKWSLTEYSTALGVRVEPLNEQAIPVLANPTMVGAHVDGKCYQGVPNSNLPLYANMIRMGTLSYTSCPVYSRQKQLAGFVYVASNTQTPPPVDIVQTIANDISIYRKEPKK